MKQFTLKSLLLVLTILMGGVNAWGEEVTLTENFYSSQASKNTYDCSSSLSTNANQTDWDYKWTASGSGTVFTNGVKLGSGKATGSISNSTMLSDIPAGSEIIVKVYAAVWNTDGGQIKFTYNGNTIQQKASNDAITTTTAEYNAEAFASSTDFSIYKVDGVNTFTIASTSKRIIIDKVQVVYTISDSGKPATPAFTLAEGTYWKEQTLELSTTVEGGTILYTTDKSDPTTSQKAFEYSDPIQIKKTTTVKACVKDKDGNFSAVAERTYTIFRSIANTQETAYTTAEAMEIIDTASVAQLEGEKVYVKGIVNEIVTEFSSKYGNITFNIISTDRKDTRVFQFFRNQKSENETYGEDPNIMIGASVVGCGNLSKHGETYEFSAKNYLVSYTTPKSSSLLATDGTANYATFSSDRDVEFVDATVYAVNVVNGVLQLNEVTSKQVPAGTGVLLQSEKETAPYFSIDKADAIENNLLKPASLAMSGSDKFYKLAYDNYEAKTGLGFYWGAANGGVFTVKAGTAYLAVPAVPNTASVKGFLLDGTPTAIEGVEAENNTDVIYNLSGQRVQKAQRGLYIVNGKKLMVK